MGEPTLSDHELLARIDERQIAMEKGIVKLDRCMTNHLAHHRAIMMMILSTLLVSIGAFVIAIWTKYN